MPKTVDPNDRRQALAAAAARVIAASGVGGATLREVAAEAGLTTGALTHYFSDKRELLVFTLRASLERRRDGHANRGVADPLADLRAQLEGVLPTNEDARLHWIVTVAFCAQACGDAELAREQRDAYRDFRRAVVDALERAVIAGLVEPGIDAQREAEHLIALADGIALQALFDPVSWPPARQLAQLDEALEALATRAAGPVGRDQASITRERSRRPR